MIHFDDSIWCDYTRGLIQGQRRAKLQSHLEVCEACRDVAGKFLRVLSSASEDRKYEVPAHVVEAARSIYNRSDFDLSVMRLGKRLAPRLVFDNFAAVPAGVRTLDPSYRHRVYRAFGQVFVDLRLERVRESAEVIIVGQITNARAPSQVLAGQNVFIVSGDSLVDRTRSNGLGEFQVRCRVDRKLRLVLPFEDAGHWVDISISRLMDIPRKLLREEPSKGKTGLRRPTSRNGKHNPKPRKRQ